MRKLLFALGFVLCAPALGLAAIGSIGTLGSCSSAVTPGTTCVITTTATLNANNLALVRVGADNFGTTDGMSSEVTNVTDSVGNTYAKICEYRYSDGGVAGNGAIAAVWVGRAATQLTTGGTITITFANSITAKTAQAQELTVTSGNTLQLAGTCLTESINDGADPGSLIISGLVSKEYYFLRHVVVEDNSVSINTTSVDWSVLTAAEDDSGTAATSIGIMAERRILTGTVETSDPSLNLFTGGNDGASIFVALEECTPTVNCAGDAPPAVTFRRPPIIVQ